MNLLVQWYKKGTLFLNTRRKNDKIMYYDIDDYVLRNNTDPMFHSASFTEYEEEVKNTPDSIYLYTTASTPEEVVKLHPELFI